jgi:8-oxo-dGTP pyrophosphatase MutT (NUDIX family)
MEYNNCNNCGKKGHIFNQCKMPIISIGIIAVRKNPSTDKMEFCMICRRNTLGFMDFIRGKYSVNNQYHISNMIKQMTESEKKMLKTMEFDDIWNNVWGTTKKLCGQYKNEEHISREKFNQLRKGVLLEQMPPPPGLQLQPYFGNPQIIAEKGNVFFERDASGNRYNSLECVKHKDGLLSTPYINKIVGYNLNMLIDNCGTYWEEAEWGFPKGRRNFNESDLDCGLREFCEETGFNYSREKCNLIHNTFPFEEIFIGSNYKSYKHKYFLMFVDYDYSLTNFKQILPNYEVSIIDWKPIDACLSSIRSYNLEKKTMIYSVNQILSRYIFR